MSSIDFGAIKEELDNFGIDAPAPDENPTVWDRVSHLCTVYNLDEEKFSDEWIAYATSNDQCPLNTQNLTLLDVHVLSKKLKKMCNERKKQHELINTYEHDQDMELDQSDGINQLLAIYGGSSQQQTPKTNIRPTTDSFSSSNFSPISNSKTSSHFSSRSNALQIVAELEGKKFTEDKENETPNWSNSNLSVESVETGVKPYRHMMCRYGEIGEFIAWRMKEFCDQLTKIHNINEISSLNERLPEKSFVFGRIYSDGLDALTPENVFLEDQAGNIGKVDLSPLDHFDIFPGQLTLFEGSNSTGAHFVAEKQLTPDLPDFYPIKFAPGMDSLSVFIASGPFTTSDTLSFEPLFALLQHVVEKKPHVLILCGPFIDVEHEKVSNAQIPITFRQAFEQLMRNMHKALQNTPTQVVFVSSGREAHGDLIFPTPPYEVQNNSYKNFHFVSDPCILRLAGVVFGITATDVLFHIKDIYKSPEDSTPRMSRLLTHLLSQQSFYPLCPPPTSVCVNQKALYQYAAMPHKPQVLLTPSNFNHFIKHEHDVVCVNPGRLCRKLFGGTFAKLNIALENLTDNSVAPWTKAQIVRI